jgi:hypothetical protein
MSRAFSLWDEMKAYAATHSHNDQWFGLTVLDPKGLRAQILGDSFCKTLPATHTPLRSTDNTPDDCFNEDRASNEGMMDRREAQREITLAALVRRVS